MSDTPQDHETWNEAMAKRFDPDAFITKSGFFIRTIEAMRLDRTRRSLKLGAGLAVLDLGCGPGNLLERLEGGRVVGFDLSDYLLAQARARVQGRAGFEVIKGDAERLPFPDGSFDRIVCSEVLEHVEKPEQVLREMRRVARSGARVVITVPNETLINLTKRVVIALGLKRWIARDYPMSDDMLDEWHRTEITEARVLDACRPLLRHAGTSSVPLPGLAFHRVLSFDV